MANGQRTTEELETDLISRYLLGELSDDQLTRVEERYFTDPSFLKQIETVEDDLIDAYVRHEMSALERQHFETHFLASPGRRERVALAGALMQQLTQQNPLSEPSRSPESLLKSGSGRQSRLPASRIAAAAAIVMLVVGVLLFLQNSSLRREVERLKVEGQRLEQSRQELEQALAAERSGKESLPDRRDDGDTVRPSPDTAPLVASFVLMPGHPRSGESVKEIRLAHTAATIRFDLAIDFAGDYKSARALLTRAGGPELWSGRGLPVRRTQGAIVVSILVPAQLLQPGEYGITLMADSGSSPNTVIADYTFRIAPGQKSAAK